MKIAFFNLNCILRDRLLSSKIVSLSECFYQPAIACCKCSYIHKSFADISANVEFLVVFVCVPPPLSFSSPSISLPLSPLPPPPPPPPGYLVVNPYLLIQVISWDAFWRQLETESGLALQKVPFSWILVLESRANATTAPTAAGTAVWQRFLRENIRGPKRQPAFHVQQCPTKCCRRQGTKEYCPLLMFAPRPYALR